MCLLNLGHGSKGDIVQLDICDILVDVQWDERDIGMLDAFKWPHLLTLRQYVNQSFFIQFDEDWNEKSSDITKVKDSCYPHA